MTEQTAKIIKAAKGHKQWGALPARQYIKRHQLPPQLVRLARQLEAVKQMDAN